MDGTRTLVKIISLDTNLGASKRVWIFTAPILVGVFSKCVNGTHDDR